MKNKLLFTTIGTTFAGILALIAKNKLNTSQSDEQYTITHRVLILGATSAIAQESTKLFAAAGSPLFLVGRNTDKMEAIVADLKARTTSQIEYAIADLNDFETHPALIKQATQTLGGLDTVLIAHGTLGDQTDSQQSFNVAHHELNTNFLSIVSLLTPIANQFEQQRYGTIAVISSVAGDRGRQSNYIYGTAKAAVSTFLQGLRNRLDKSGVQVLTIKPGFVDTPMTADIEKGPLFVGPDVIAKGIYQAINKQQDIVYLPWFWWGIMNIIRHIPEPIFKKLSL